jgi:hypothetical protein
VPDGHPAVRVVICMPDDDATRAAVSRAHAEILKNG